MTGLLGTHVPQIFKLHKAMFLKFIELNVMKGNETRMQMGAASQAQNHVGSHSRIYYSYLAKQPSLTISFKNGAAQI